MAAATFELRRHAGGPETTDLPSHNERLPAKVYGDALSPSVREVGQTLASAVHLALTPANFAIRSVQAVVDYVEVRVKERFEEWKTPPEDVTSPRPEIAAQVVQALRFADQDEALREMFLDLLARSMDARQREQVHPAFVEVVRQLDPTEARNLKNVLDYAGLPVVEVRLRISSSPAGHSFRTLLRHVTFVVGDSGDPAEMARWPSMVDNWIRLGLVRVTYESSMADIRHYGWIDNRPELKRLRAEAGQQADNIYCQKGILEPTDFGKEFGRAVGIGGNERGLPDLTPEGGVARVSSELQGTIPGGTQISLSMTPPFHATDAYAARDVILSRIRHLGGKVSALTEGPAGRLGLRIEFERPTEAETVRFTLMTLGYTDLKIWIHPSLS